MSIPGGIKLHIGGVEPRAGWSILNISAGPHVDYVGDCGDLSFLGDDSCAEIYASHVLEHLGHDQVQQAVHGFYRVLRPGGRLRVAVPDMETLCRMFLRPDLTAEERFHVMMILFGGRGDAHDIHGCGLSFEFLDAFLRAAEFVEIARVGDFGLFKDMSQTRFKGEAVSLNMEAYKYYK